MSKKSTAKPLALVISAALVGSLAMSTTANAAENPFGATSITAATTITVAGKDGKCGEGKCGKKTKGKEAKCGAKGKKKDGKCGAKGKKKDGKCGEGKCGKK
ncbi:Flagellar biosynthesis protein FlhA [hydrothermal vent metagenome]|uniref:Flagellar biosynthesis protein FlhA n=1 Tax=hydrothermal vent metagenome TaxID=652676 RepID=A0A3B0Y9X8_9ZZZZ